MTISRQVPEEKREEFMVSWTNSGLCHSCIVCFVPLKDFERRDSCCIRLHWLRNALAHVMTILQYYNIQVFPQIETGVASRRSFVTSTKISSQIRECQDLCWELLILLNIVSWKSFNGQSLIESWWCWSLYYRGRIYQMYEEASKCQQSPWWNFRPGK